MSRARFIQSPSQHSAELLRRLRDAVRPPRLFQRKDDPGPYLAALAATTELGVLPDLIGIILEADPKWYRDCASTVAAIAEPMLPNDLPLWDEWVRRSYSAFSVFSYSDDPWRRLNRKSIDGIQITSRSEAVLVGLLGSHNDGYVRESVLVRLAQIHTGDELGFLILRTNDWVPAIQIRAHTALTDRLRPEFASSFVRHLVLLNFLVRAKRADHSGLLATIDSFLRSEAVRPALGLGLDAPDYRLRRRCYELMYGAYTTAPEWLSAKAIADSDVVVRYQGFRYSLTSDPSRILVQMAINDPFTPIRRMAFGIEAERGITADSAILRDFLFDRSSQLRHDAQRHWRDRGLGDPADVYRKSLDENLGSKTPQAVLGLGETGTLADAKLVLNCLNDHRSKVRSAAVRSICRLQPDGFLDIVTEILLRDGRAVANSAEMCLRKHIRRIETGRLWNLALSTTNPDSQIRILRMFRQLGKWDRLEYLLRAIMTSDSSQTFALSELEDWSNRFNRTFTTLTPAHRSSLTTLLSTVKTQLSSRKVSEIEFVLRHG